ncbi:MAG: hypothetical protein EB127_18525, partial [Alphaproteobacteria bacterium]|nr:hypothetical protein [Alphaproteobacteria bacterium]
MDTRYWGPSGWELFHLIAFKSENPEKILGMMKDVLPCKFCRESTAQYTEELPLKGDPGKWLYDIHNKVNQKLRSQCMNDPQVINPGPDPSFDEIKKRYESLKPSKVPGRDFLFSIAANYPEIPLQEQKEVQQKFLSALSETYPFKSLQEVFREFCREEVLINKKLHVIFCTDLDSFVGYCYDWKLSFYKTITDAVKSTGINPKTFAKQNKISFKKIWDSYTCWYMGSGQCNKDVYQ